MGAVLCFGAPKTLAGPLAGTPIPNTASGSGLFAGGSTPVSTSSNTVAAVVQPLESLVLVAPRHAVLAPAQSFAFAHRLTNSGNASFDFRLDATNAAGDAFDAASLAVVRDANGNGVFDAGDVTLPPGGTVTLGPGASADLLVTGVVPVAAPPAARARVVLSATGLAQGATAANEDTLETIATASNPVLRYFTASDYLVPTRFGTAGQPLYVQVDAPGWNRDASRADTAQVALASARGADVETYLAIETAPASGVFRIQPAVGTAPQIPPGVFGVNASVHGDRVLTTMRGDIVDGLATPYSSASVPGGRTAAAAVWMDPASRAFEAHTALPVGGVVVSLVDVSGDGNGGVPGGPARVFARDGVSPAPSTVASDANGVFEFPLVLASTYRFDVVPAAGFRFPTTVPFASLPAGAVADPSGSYGGSFTLTDSLAPLTLDVPLDGASGAALFVEKSALRSYVELGETMDYELRVANRSEVPLDSVALVDHLPSGFAYLAGTARDASGASIADPAGGGGPVLTFAVGTLGAGEVRTVRYRVRIGSGAVDGDGINRAWATSGTLQSNTASAKVELTYGVFSRDAAIVGRVFVDSNRDGRMAYGEPGMPGVRLYLDDGTFTVTDGDGRYSFYDIPARTHALKVDPTTLPSGSRAIPTDARDRDTPGLAFVDPSVGDMIRVDFSVPGDTTLLEESQRRMIAGVVGRDETAREVARGGAPLEPRREAADPRTLPAEAITTGETRLPLFGHGEGTRAQNAVAGPRATAPDSSAANVAEPLERTLHTLGAGVGFVELAARDTVAGDQLAVWVKGPLGASFRLSVNGEAVAESRVGKKLAAPDAGVEAWQYVGVKLAPGANRLDVAASNGGSATVEVTAPDRPGSLTIDAPHVVAADGFTPSRVIVSLADARGVPVATRTIVTLEATLGRLSGEDLDPGLSGLQLAVEGGRAAVDFYPPGTPGIAELRATGAGLEGHARVEFAPDLRPFLTVGSLEGTLGLSRRMSGSGGTAASGVKNGGVPRPMFGEPISNFTAMSADGDAFAGIRGTLFMKGRLQQDILLTLGYDSDRDPNMRRLRDIQPDAAYPLYGDASVKGFEAQSSRNFYARVDRRGASLLYGDFVTPGGGGTRTLASYSRSLNGVAGTYEARGVRVDGYTSRDRAARAVDEIRGRGTSGPYRVSKTPLIENSERVEIVVRDRNQPQVILSTALRQRFVDYEINWLSGEILMRAPVPSVDSDLNPVSLRVTYEVETGGDPFWVTGLEARSHVLGPVELGGTYVDDHNPQAQGSIRSVFASAKLDPYSTLEAEFATTHSDSGWDDGARVEWRRTAPGIEARVYGATAGADFANPTSGYAAGRAEAGGRLSYVVSPRTRLLGEAIYNGIPATGARRAGLLLAVDRRLDDMWRVELGTRLADGAAGTDVPDTLQNDFQATVRAKATAQLPWAKGLSAYGEFEQDTQDWDRKMAALGGEWRFMARGRIYARHEFISSLIGPYALSDAQRRHSTVAGADVNLTPDARVFSEYRADGVFGAREGEAAVGLSNAWKLPGGARIYGSLERVQPMGNFDRVAEGAAAVAVAPGASTALTMAVDYSQNVRWKGSARFEFRTARESDGVLSTLAGAYRLGNRWSALGRSWFSFNTAPAGGSDVRERLQLGFAYRPGPGWDMLGRYELHYENSIADGVVPGAPGGSATNGTTIFTPANERHLAHVVSFHGAGPLGEKTTGSLAWSGKLGSDDVDGFSSRVNAQWVHGRATWALAPKWDAGLATSVLLGGSDQRGGIGGEVGRRVQPGLWMSLGYNLTGYADDDLTGEEWTRQGVYMRVRAKFDESLFQGGAK